jgi:hypothetical protein
MGPFTVVVLVKPIVAGMAPVDAIPYAIASGKATVVEPVPMNMKLGATMPAILTVLDAPRPTFVTADREPEAVWNEPTNNPPVLRNDDAPVPELLSTEAEPEAVWNDPADKPAGVTPPPESNVNAAVPELASTDEDPVAAVMIDAATDVNETLDTRLD